MPTHNLREVIGRLVRVIVLTRCLDGQTEAYAVGAENENRGNSLIPGVGRYYPESALDEPKISDLTQACCRLVYADREARKLIAR